MTHETMQKVHIARAVKARRLQTFIQNWNICTCKKPDCPWCQPLIGKPKVAHATRD